MKKLIILCSIVFVLAACGGDGGGGMTDSEIRALFPPSASLLTEAGCTHVGIFHSDEYALDATVYECLATLDSAMKDKYKAYGQDLANASFNPEEPFGVDVDGDYFGLYEKFEGSKVYMWSLLCWLDSEPCDIQWTVCHDISKC